MFPGLHIIAVQGFFHAARSHAAGTLPWLAREPTLHSSTTPM